MNGEQDIMNNLCNIWGIDKSEIFMTASKFFNDYKKLSVQTDKQKQTILDLQVKCILNS